MLCSEMIAVCSEVQTKHVNTLCGQNVEFLSNSFVMSVRQSVRMEQLGSHWTDFDEV